MKTIGWRGGARRNPRIGSDAKSAARKSGISHVRPIATPSQKSRMIAVPSDRDRLLRCTKAGSPKPTMRSSVKKCASRIATFPRVRPFVSLVRRLSHLDSPRGVPVPSPRIDASSLLRPLARLARSRRSSRPETHPDTFDPVTSMPDQASVARRLGRRPRSRPRCPSRSPSRSRRRSART